MNTSPVPVLDIPAEHRIDYKWVAIGDMFLPPCQASRALDEGKVARIVANWNAPAFGTPILSFREHGNRGPKGEAFAIVAGQHRIEAARRLGMTRVMCCVVYGLDEAAEARLFIDEDTRKAQSVIGKFHVARLAHDPEASAIWDIANAHGFIIVRGLGENYKRAIRCVASITRAYRDGVLADTLSVLAAAFDHDVKGSSSFIVDGLSTALRYRTDLDKKKLADRLRSVGVDGIMRRYRSGVDAFAQSGRRIVMANVMIDAYNYRATDATRVAPISYAETRLTNKGSTFVTGREKGVEVLRAIRKGKTLAEARAEVAARRTAANA